MSEQVLVVGAPLSLAALLVGKPAEADQFVAEGALLGEIVDRAAVTQKEGSFSARNPSLGKMQKCKVCGIRERGHECRAKIKKEVSINRKQRLQINSVATKAAK